MFEMTQPAVISATSIGQSGPMSDTCGLDLLASIQILLIKDYDSQLKGMASQIKGTTQVKKNYRQEIENLQNLLISSPSKKINDKDSIQLTPAQKGKVDQTKDFVSNLTGNEVKTKTTFESTSVSKTEFKQVTDRIYNAKTRRYEVQTRKEVSGYWVPKEAIEKKIENYKQKLDSLNEQSDLMSLGLQSLTNQRKIAFETISNLVSKYHDGVSSIVRNIKS